MANHVQAKKRIRQIERRTRVNNERRTRTRTIIRRVEEAISAGNQVEALDAFKEAQPVMMRSAQKGIFHKKTVSRKLSRLSARIKVMAA
jgi:small subunit ribosomal protein S20